MRKVLFITTILAALMLPLQSCNLSPSQGKVVAQNAGLAAGVTWVAYDNPTRDEINIVKGVLGLIKGVTADTINGATYTQVLFPTVEDYLNKLVEDGSIKPNEKPLALAGSLALLNGIDLLFATNPKWGENEEQALSIVNAFVQGAETGLSLSDDDQRIINARQSHATRARAFKGTSK